jgi:hypothetical protein
MKKTSNHQIFAHGTNLGHEHDVDCVIELAFKSRERMPVPSGVSMIQSVIYCPPSQHGSIALMILLDSINRVAGKMGRNAFSFETIVAVNAIAN